jgi:hypothetical protein
MFLPTVDLRPQLRARSQTMRKFLGAILALSLVMTAGTAFAVSGDITATANVLTPLSVTNNLRDLDFGDVFPGVNKSVAFGDATSGKWQVSGEAGGEIAVTFTLPATLASGPNSMTISFSGTDAAYNAADVVGAATAFDPGAGTTQNLDGATGDMFFWIGGTVAPTPAQVAGVYTGTVTLDAVYTGN